MTSLETAVTTALGAPGRPAADGFGTAVAHLYRGEMHRMTVWRQRLDITSNWAILLTVGLTTFTLGSAEVPHFILLLGLALIAISILIEARRYRHLHHSKWRLFVMEQGYFAPLLRGAPADRAAAWREVLAKDLEEPRFLIGWFCAARARLRRNYLLLLYFITGVWLTKLFVHPASPATAAEFHARLAVGDLIPAWAVAVTATAFVAVCTVLALTCPTTEVLETFPGEPPAAP